MRVTVAVHRFINYVKQYEKCDPAAGEIPLSVPLLAGNCEPDNLVTNYLKTAKPILRSAGLNLSYKKR